MQSVDTVAFEIDPLDEAVQREMADGLARVPVRPLKPEQRTRLARQMQVQCLPLDNLDTVAAEVHLMNLTVSAGRFDGLDAMYGSEIMLSLLAHGLQRSVVSLETVKFQLNLLLAANDADAETAVQEGLEDLESGLVRKVLQKTVRVWESADLDSLTRYTDWCECIKTAYDQEQMRRMLDERNPAMALRVDALHAGGKNVLVAVGALHMVGPNGLTALLAKRGYRVERVH
jgi:hypothetical protein